MMQRADPNLEILARAVARLGYLADRTRQLHRQERQRQEATMASDSF